MAVLTTNKLGLQIPNKLHHLQIKWEKRHIQVRTCREWHSKEKSIEHSSEGKRKFKWECSYLVQSLSEFFHSEQLLVQIMPSKVSVFAKERPIAASRQNEFIDMAPNGGTLADQRFNLLSEILESTKTCNNSWKMQSMGTVRTFIPTFLPGKKMDGWNILSKLYMLIYKFFHLSYFLFGNLWTLSLEFPFSLTWMFDFSLECHLRHILTWVCFFTHLNVPFLSLELQMV